MDNIILIIGILLILTACIIAVTERLRSKRILDSIEKMLHMAMNDEFSAETFDEGRLSKLESELAAFLSSSSISAKNIENERDKIKSLISDISHQTKTPIANLILYSELLENSELSGVDRTNAEAIHAQAEKLRFLIDSLVKLSRLENGILALEPQETPLMPLLEDIVRQFEEKAEKKGLKLELNKTDAKAVIDAKWTHEAIANIVDNAIKYTENGCIKISVNPYEMFVRVDIKDTGIGISEEEHSKIFKRFYRGTEVKQKEGVGIGLHLAREIISGEGGYIKLSSAPGEGAIFSVFLPRN